MKRLACYSALALFGASALASAHGYRDDFDYARVTRVEPIYETTTYRVPRDECWSEQVPVHSSYGAPHSSTGPILGAIIGGAIGNALGHHEVNKKVGTIAGVALGASVGRDVSYRNRDDDRVSYRDERVCKTVADTETREEVVAYRVFYTYNGRDFVTRMADDPGSRIRVRVNVEPD